MGTHISEGLIPPDDPRLQRISIVVGQTLSFGPLRSAQPKPDSDQEDEEAQPWADEAQSVAEESTVTGAKPVKTAKFVSTAKKTTRKNPTA